MISNRDKKEIEKNIQNKVKEIKEMIEKKNEENKKK